MHILYRWIYNPISYFLNSKLLSMCNKVLIFIIRMAVY